MSRSPSGCSSGSPPTKKSRCSSQAKLTLPPEKKPAAGAKKVAVIGAGPAGLTVADDLADRGFAVTVYEAQPAAGGMLRYGIPEYRLPKKVLDHEVELIRRKGVRFVFNCRVGKDITLGQLRKDNDAVFIAAGVTVGRRLGVEGENKPGVLQGVEFLRQAGSTGKKPAVKDRVVVIGGGNVAVDVARTALRLGAKSVEMVSLEQRDEMPAYPEEVEATLEEGIKIRNGWGPRRILGNGSVTGIELKRCTRVFDENKRFSPVYDEQQRLSLEADQIIVAIGQTSDEEFVKHIGAATQGRYFKADPVTLETSLDGVFAGGDAVSGPKSVIEAVAAGKRAAEIHRTLPERQGPRRAAVREHHQAGAGRASARDGRRRGEGPRQGGRAARGPEGGQLRGGGDWASRRSRPWPRRSAA